MTRLVAVADLHVEWVVPCLATPIDSYVVASVCLINVDIALLRHVVEVLRRVHTLTQGGGPRGGIHTSPLVLHHRRLVRIDISINGHLYRIKRQSHAP